METEEQINSAVNNYYNFISDVRDNLQSMWNDIDSHIKEYIYVLAKQYNNNPTHDAQVHLLAALDRIEHSDFQSLIDIPQRPLSFTWGHTLVSSDIYEMMHNNVTNPIDLDDLSESLHPAAPVHENTGPEEAYYAYH